VARPAPKPTSFYSVQLAAYDTPDQATRLMRLLVSRGIDARVDGKMRPFRVRVGKYTTRAQAVKAAATLKSRGHSGFVVLVSTASR
jgi:cell division protein FtsN